MREYQLKDDFGNYDPIHVRSEHLPVTGEIIQLKDGSRHTVTKTVHEVVGHNVHLLDTSVYYRKTTI